jgi:hypothetical protein
MFNMTAIELTLNDQVYTVPATELRPEQVEHMIRYAVRVRLDRAAAGLADDPAKAREKRLARIKTVYEIEAVQERAAKRDPLEVEIVNMMHKWLRDNHNEKSAVLRDSTTINACAALAAKYLKDDPTLGTSEQRVAGWIKHFSEQAATVVAAAAAALAASKNVKF